MTTDTQIAEPPCRERPAPRTILPLNWSLWYWNQARKVVVFVVGSTLILLGVVMLVIPGPGWLTIFGGLAVLATEFAWAKWMLSVARERASQLVDAAKRQVTGEPKSPES